MVIVESRIPFPRGWERRSTAEGWDSFRVFINPGAPPPPTATNAKAYTQVIPFPKPWEKRHAPEAWDSFRLMYNATPAPPPPAGNAKPIIVQFVPMPRDGTMDARRPDGWTLFRPFWRPPATTVQMESSLRFWPDDEAQRITPWGYFRPYWQNPGAPPPPPVAPWNAYRVPPSGWAESRDEARRTDHWALFRPYWTPYVPPPPPPPPPPPGPGGGIRRNPPRRKFLVEFDGKRILAEGDDAEQLLEILRQRARERAEAEAERVVQKRKKSKRKKLSLAPVVLEPPKVTTNAPDVGQYQAAVNEAYWYAAQQALASLKLAQQLLDDEEAISVLI